LVWVVTVAACFGPIIKANYELMSISKSRRGFRVRVQGLWGITKKRMKVGTSHASRPTWVVILVYCKWPEVSSFLLAAT
jgi:hypothetical protein